MILSLSVLLMITSASGQPRQVEIPNREPAALRTIQQALRAHGPEFNGNRADAPFCTLFYKDVVAGQNIDPIVPVFEATIATDSRLKRLVCPLPRQSLGPRPIEGLDWRYFERKWRYILDPAQRWQPPFRLYEVDLDANPANGLETLLFHAGRAATVDSPARPAGYAWLDVPSCQLKAEVPIGWPTPVRGGKGSPVESHALVNYRGPGAGTVVLDLLMSPPGTQPSWLAFDATRFGAGDALHCSWSSVASPTPGNLGAGKEAAKLQAILKALRANGDQFEDRSSHPMCGSLLHDLFTGRDIEALEPTFETSDNEDPRILKLTCPFDVEDSPQMHRSGDPSQHFRSARDLHQAPYRLYHVELDGDPNTGSETVLYHTGRLTNTGYTWVDFPRCWRRRLAVVSKPAPEIVAINLLARYRREGMMLDLATSTPDALRPRFSLHAWRFTTSEPTVCHWNFGER